MKALKILVIIFGLTLLMNCKYGQNHKYTYTAKVTYMNNDVDTLAFSYDSFKGNLVYVNLKIADGGLFTSSGNTPCLIVGCGFYYTVIACGVRKYEILNEVKVALNNN